MKKCLLILALAITGCIGARYAGAARHGGDPYDPDVAVYQPGLAGIPHRVSIPIGKIDTKAENAQYLASRGRHMVYWGAILMVAGIAFAATMRSPLLDTIGQFVGASGAGGIVTGMILMQVAQWWAWISVAIAVGASIALVIYFRDRGITIRRPKRE